MLIQFGWKLDAVINFSVPDEVIVKRISGRRVCEVCGAVYHTENKPPQVEGICDLDSGKLIQRVDDMAETVQRRLRVYNDQTAPVIGYYEQTGSIIHVDGTKSIKEVDATIKKVLGEMN